MYTESGSEAIVDANGCAATLTVTITTNQPIDVAEGAELCDDGSNTFTSPTTGTVYTESGSENITDANGCAATLTVTITSITCTDPCEVVAGTISADVSTVCVGNAIVNVTIDAAGTSENSIFVITDSDGTNILGTPSTDSGVLDLSGAAAGTCQIWLLNYDGELTIPTSGLVADLEGCFVLSNAIDIVREDCTDPCEVVAGTISADVSTVCVGNAIVNVTIDDAGTSENSIFVITDSDGTNILGTPSTDSGVLDLSGAAAGTCQIWLLNYDGELTIPTSGLVADLEGCFVLSNAIDIVREDCTDPCEVVAGTISADVSTVCVGNAIVNVTIDDAGTSENSIFVITDSDGTNILGTPSTDSGVLDLSGAAAGTCQIWLLNYDGELTIPTSGLVADLEGCFVLSNAIDILREDCTDPCEVVAGTISADVSTVCVGNAIVNVTIDDAGTSENSIFIITDFDGTNILGTPSTDSGVLDLSAAAAGTCQIWLLNYDGELTIPASGLVADLEGCFVLSTAIDIVREDCTVNCDDFGVSVSGVCNESDTEYTLAIAVAGVAGDTYTITSSSDAALNGTTVSGSFNAGPFVAGAAFDYTITSDGNTDCSATVSASQFVCTTTAIELIEFNGRTLDSANEIYWTTATETDNDFFTLERSNDGINFDVITNVNGSGTTSTPTAYNFIDNNASTTSFYRLLATDYNGVTEVVSNVIELTRSSELTVNVHPVPANDVINIELGLSASDISVLVIDITGKVVKSVDYAGENQNMQLNINDLSSGTYFLQVQHTNGEFISTKFIKK